MVKYASNKDGTINYRIQIYEDNHGKEVPSIENMTSFRYRPDCGKGIITLTVRPALTDSKIIGKIQSRILSHLYMDTSEVVRIIEKGMKKS